MMYRWILNLFEPFIRWMGKIYFGFKKPQLTSQNYEEVRNLLDPCDIILSASIGELSNFFNPTGKEPWSHAAIYVGKEKLMEAIGKGVLETHLIDFVLKHDAIIILRPHWLWHPEAKKTIVEFAINQKGKSYDYDFNDSDNSDNSDNEFYCFELVADSYEKAFPAIGLKKKKILDGEFYVADSFLTGPFEIIYDSRKKYAPRIH